MPDYLDIRTLHIACALISLAGFVFRGVLMLRNSPHLRSRWTRTLPHINDTILLMAAIALVVRSAQYPWAHGWLAAKIGGLLAYIGLGFVAFRFGSSLRIRTVAWLAAIVVYCWMLSVARLRHPLGALQLLI